MTSELSYGREMTPLLNLLAAVFLRMHCPIPKATVIESAIYIAVTHVLKVFRYCFGETIPMFFNHIKSDFILVRSLQNFHQ